MAEGSDTWVERFKMHRVHASYVSGNLNDEALSQLQELQDGAAARGKTDSQLICLLARMQIAVVSPHPNKDLACELLRASDALLAQLAPIPAVEAASPAPYQPALVEELRYMLTIVHVSYSVRFDDSASFGQTAEERLRKALTELSARADGGSDDGGGDAGLHASGRWFPLTLRLAFLHLLAARVRRTNDTKRALNNIKRGEQAVDVWLARAKIFESNAADSGAPIACAGCRTPVANAALKIKSALAEVAYHVMTTQVCSCTCSHFEMRRFTLKCMIATSVQFRGGSG